MFNANEMSDSEEDVVDQKIKIAFLGDTSVGKVKLYIYQL